MRIGLLRYSWLGIGILLYGFSFSQTLQNESYLYCNFSSFCFSTASKPLVGSISFGPTFALTEGSFSLNIGLLLDTKKYYSTRDFQHGNTLPGRFKTPRRASVFFPFYVRYAIIKKPRLKIHGIGGFICGGTYYDNYQETNLLQIAAGVDFESILFGLVRFSISPVLRYSPKAIFIGGFTSIGIPIINKGK